MVTLMEAKLEIQERNDTHGKVLIRVSLGNGSVDSSHARHNLTLSDYSPLQPLTLSGQSVSSRLFSSQKSTSSAHLEPQRRWY